ncbi:MAG: ribonuclease III [Nitrosomonadaceae bacterium]|nr:ribonuclease III [Nitrosomonadaceae bacterium]|tara:strand:+ start:1654 stop:2325 length:672 start_codon:yes stop_codon:yes gene_type:complete
MDSNELCQRIGYNFNNPEYLYQALTHRSYSHSHNERLEFLGDSILNCAVAGLVFRTFSNLPEGHLTRLRANLVNQEALFKLAKTLDLGNYIKLGEGERKSGGCNRPSILADALEAILGAVYLDGGFVRAEEIIITLFTPLLPRFYEQNSGKDPKTILQEYLQSHKIMLPQYSVVVTTGEAHQKTFCVECVITKLRICAIGEGSSRRSAEQEAAKKAYEQINQK